MNGRGHISLSKHNNKSIIDRDMPIGELKRIKDFLPPPGELFDVEVRIIPNPRLSNPRH